MTEPANELVYKQKSPHPTLDELAIVSIAPSTLSLYTNRIEIIKQHCRKTGHLFITMEAFGGFLNHLAVTSKSSSTIQGYHSALLFFQEVHRLDLGKEEQPWAKDPIVMRAVEGAKCLSKRKSTDIQPRGYVTESMLTQLVAWFAVRRDGLQLADALKVQYYAALRSCEVELLRGGDLCGEGNRMYLVVRCDKTQKFSTDRLRNKPLHPYAISIIQPIMNTVPHGYLAFPAYKKRNVSKCLKQAAKELAWPPGVRFDGTHTLRHGGTEVVVNEALDVMMDALSGMSSRVRERHYMRPRNQ